MARKTVRDKIIDAVYAHSMLKRGDRVLVGFSGGKDSAVLLHSLNSLSDTLGIEVFALHVNHGIRGDEADRDQEFCMSFCRRLNVPFFAERVDAPRFASENGMGLEEGARELRYSVLNKYFDALKADRIATAHTMSDNLETVIFNLARGASADGLKGIPPVRDNIIRPLIDCTTDDVLAYAEENGIAYVTDSTNADTAYSRNRIRHEVVPALKCINPRVEDAVMNTCRLLSRDVGYIKGVSVGVADMTPYGLSLLHSSVLSRVLTSGYKEKTTSGQLSSGHIEDMMKLIDDFSSGDDKGIKRMSLPDGVDFVVKRDGVSFEKRRGEQDRPKFSFDEKVLEMGLNELDGTGDAVLMCFDENDACRYISKNVYKKSTHIIVKNVTHTDTIKVRCKKDGDVFEFSNMTKKVKKMYNEAGIPVEERATLPVFCDSKGIFWIPSFPLRDDMKPEGDGRLLHIFYLKRES